MAKFRDSEFYEKETIIGIGGKLSTKTEKAKKEDAYNRLVYTRESQSGDDAVITGRVVGVEATGSYVAAIVTYEGFKILIEDKEFMDFPEFDPERYPYPDEKKMHEVFMNSCIGAEIDFCVLPKIRTNGKSKVIDTIDLDSCVAWASRKSAMRKRYRQMWCKHRDGSRYITEGRAVEARVVRVSNTCVFFESNGVEFKVPIDELSWSRIENARNYFAPGEKHIVRLQKIQYAEDEETTMPEVTASVKQMKEDPKEKWCRMINVGEIYLGKITAQHGNAFFVRLQNGAEVYCIAAKNLSRYPSNGDECTVAINIKDTEKNRLFGKIIALSQRDFLL